jgi:hypothetical protein
VSLPELNDIQSAHDLVGVKSPAAAAATAAGQQQSQHDISRTACKQASCNTKKFQVLL